MGRLRQEGASGLMIAVILVLLVVVLLVTRVLSRLGDSADDRNTTLASLQRARTALDQYVAAAGAAARLPCPADPAQDTGLEDPTPPTGNCNSDTGTLPWRTIGLRRDDAYDAWGRKLSYRVYSGNKGNLTLAGGPSMVDCTYDSSAAAQTGAGATSAGGCRTDHTTTQSDFLSVNGKGLKLYDMGVQHSDATNDPTAYVVISHGPTGYGGYTSTGAQLNNPPGDERDNTRNTGPFHIEAWSDPDTAATSNQHFDDLLAYRTIRDLAFSAGLQGRKWIVALLNTTFDAATVNAAIAASGSPTSVDFGTFTATGFTGATAANLVLDTTGSTEGLGVGGGFNNQVSSTGSESVKLTLDNHKTAKSASVSLNNFGTYILSFFGTYTYTEQVTFTFYNGATVVDTQSYPACNSGQGLVTFNLTPSGDFDALRITPTAAVASPSFFPGDTSFNIAAFAACTSATCTTGLPNATTCP